MCIGQSQVHSRPHNKWLELVDKPHESKANLSAVSTLVINIQLELEAVNILLTTQVWPNKKASILPELYSTLKLCALQF